MPLINPQLSILNLKHEVLDFLIVCLLSLSYEYESNKMTFDIRKPRMIPQRFLLYRMVRRLMERYVT